MFSINRVYIKTLAGCGRCSFELDRLFITPIKIKGRLFIRTKNMRNADILIINGIMTSSFREEISSLYAYIPKPITVITFGSCSITGGIYGKLIGEWFEEVDAFIPVNIRVFGCPPMPESLIYEIGKISE